jgi:hypothetical protein
MTTKNDQISDKHTSILGLLLRIFWMLLGNAILLFSAVFVFQGKDWMFHTADAVFWSTAAALVLARYLEIKFYNGLTNTGEPASMSHWRKYAAMLLICSAVVWTLLHIVTYMRPPV